jgi:hypothetical protein
LVGAEGRAELLRSLGAALELHPEFFSSSLAATAAAGGGAEEGEAAATKAVFRPGYMVDYLMGKADPATKEVGWWVGAVLGCLCGFLLFLTTTDRCIKAH